MKDKKSYDSFVNSFIRGYNGKEKCFVMYLLNSTDVKDSYDSIVRGEVAGDMVNKVFRRSVDDVKKDNKSRPEEFVNYLSSNLAQTKKHDNVVDDFFKNGSVGERNNVKPGSSVFKWNYFRGFMLLLLVVAGFFFVRSASNFDLMEAVQGESVVDLNVIYGTIFLVLGLVFVHIYYRKKEENQRKEENHYIKDIMMISFLFASFFIIKSMVSGSFLGAVAGGGVSDLDIVYGSILLLFGLALAHFYYNRK